ATPALVMNRFEPLRTYSPSSRRAPVRIAAESEPEPDSVSAYAQSHSPDASRGSQRSFCPESPASFSPSEPSSCTARISPLVAQRLVGHTGSLCPPELMARGPVACDGDHHDQEQHDQEGVHGLTNGRGSGSVTRSLLGRVADRLDVVAVRIVHEGRVVVGMD